MISESHFPQSLTHLYSSMHLFKCWQEKNYNKAQISYQTDKKQRILNTVERYQETNNVTRKLLDFQFISQVHNTNSFSRCDLIFTSDNER